MLLICSVHQRQRPIRINPSLLSLEPSNSASLGSKPRSAIIIKRSTLLRFHAALKTIHIFSSNGGGQTYASLRSPCTGNFLCRGSDLLDPRHHGTQAIATDGGEVL